jgi:hypothetical protein
MKWKLFSIGVGLLLSGCAGMPTDFAARMSSAAKDYNSIKVAMNKEQAISRLGQPQKSDGNTSTWETRYDSGNYESIVIDFDRSGHIDRIKRKHHKRSKWAFGTSTVVTYSEKPGG